MAASGAGGGARTPRRGPAPIASFDHDNSDESSPETKQAIRLPEIREDPSCSTSSVACGDSLAPPEQRARSHSTPAASGLQTPAAPRIEFSRASSSSHQDSRDSSPELALFAGTTTTGEDARARLELGFREDGALDLRSSTEELAFLEPAPGEPRPTPASTSAERRHSRKDSQGSEAALLAVSGRTSRLSSIGSQCSAHSALSGFSHTSKVSRLSVVSGVSRSPSPHRMLLETSFCGPKPIETDPEICAAAVEERLLEMAKLNSSTVTTPGQVPAPVLGPVDARDRREVRTEATVERASSRMPSINTRVPIVPSVPTAPTVTVTVTTSSSPIAQSITTVASPQQEIVDDKREKETKNRAKAERRARSRDRRESREPEVKRSANRSKDIIRIRLKPDSEYEDDDDESERTLIGGDLRLKPATLALGSAARPSEVARTSITSATSAPNATSPTPSRHRGTRDSRTPSPAGQLVSRKSSFCSLFKSRETIASPDSPSDALRRKKSLTDGRSRSRSRDRSATPTSAAKIKGSVLSLFKTPRKSATSPSPSSRDGSPIVPPQRQIVNPVTDKRKADRLKYYEDAKDGIIHIPLRTPPDELDGSGPSSASTSGVSRNLEDETEVRVGEVTPHREPSRPSSAPVTSTRQVASAASTRPITMTTSTCSSATATAARPTTKPIQRTVLPDGSIIIPLHSPTEKKTEQFPEVIVVEKKEDKKCEANSDVVKSPSEKSIVSPKNGFQEIKSQTSEMKTVAQVDTVLPKKTPDERPKKKERLMFSTLVGSRDQVFSTQFSITKTPSVTSEISESFASFSEKQADEIRTPTLRDTHITTSGLSTPTPAAGADDVLASPQDAARDSSESESSETAPPRSGNDVEQRGLVVQESFEDELPYVPTTLPMERSLALPMVPVRDRGDVRVAPLERPRATTPRNSLSGPGARPPPISAPPPAGARPPPDKIRIKLPRRPRTASASGPTKGDRARARTRSGSEGYESRAKTDWIDFEEVPERRKQPKRIQTLPTAATSATATAAPSRSESRDVVYSYVEREHCRCECHQAEPEPDERPLLARGHTLSSSSLECGSESHEAEAAGGAGSGAGGGAGSGAAGVQPSVHVAPFTADLDLHDAPAPATHRSSRPH